MASRLVPGVVLPEPQGSTCGQRVVAAIAATPRHYFVEPESQMGSYRDLAIPIGFGRRCARPSVVARLLDAANISPGHRVLVLAAGTGYVAAVAAAMGAQVDAVEGNGSLVERAARAVALSGQAERVKLAPSLDATAIDTEDGWDSVVVEAAALKAGRPLLRLIRPGGVAIVPVRRSAGVELTVYGRVQRGHVRRSLGGIDVDALSSLPVTGL